jgi:hypothetical protein
MAKKPFLQSFFWILPLSLGLGALLSALNAGSWWIGWLAYALILLCGFSGLAALWRWAGAGRTLGLMLVLTAALRLGLGVAISFVMPAYGYPDSRVNQAGYAFQDAYNRDTQAWELAHRPDPIWKAFDKTSSTDQYGGLLALSTLVYRYLSPDAHRSWLIILVGALTAAAGVALAWKAIRQTWGRSMAGIAAWILVLFPESILLGSSQMREPFLITFVAMLFWGIVDWQSSHRGQAWAWMAGSLAGMLLVSPGVAVLALIGLGGWAWLRSRERRISWLPILVVLAVLGAGLTLLGFGLARGALSGASPYALLVNWLPVTAKWDAYVLAKNSSWIKQVFEELPQPLHFPFITGYGVTQPLLPATLFDPAVWPWRIITVLLALGWYGLLPFLAAGLLAAWKVPEKNERRAWIWLWAITWAWIFISAIRAGGDQWDNPRYRAMILLWQAILAAKAFLWWRETHNPWMVRLLAVEAVFLVSFGFWYSSRYGSWASRPVHIFTILAAILVISGLILAGGWIQDLLRKRRANRA